MTRLRVAFSDMKDGNMSFIYGAPHDVRADRAHYLAGYDKTLGQCVCMATPHTDTIVAVSKRDAGSGMHELMDAITAEALVTQDPHLALCFAPADCFPVVYFDSQTGTLALAHLGRKPATLHLAQKVLRYLTEHYQSKLADIRITIGPGIHASSYILASPPQAECAEWQPYVQEVSDATYEVDVLGFILNDLHEAGIAPDQIDLVYTYDTASNRQQFSHFRANKTSEPEGRFLACAWIE